MSPKFHLLVTTILIAMVQLVLEASQSGYCSETSGTDRGKECKSALSHFSPKRYILYNVNAPEGFNLRRDVYIRVATFVNKLVTDEPNYHWKLVLPPWGDLYHWRSTDAGPQKQIPWGLFFDITSLRNYVPVLEMYEFIEEYISEDGETTLDLVYFLKNDEEMFKTGHFQDKNLVEDCSINSIPYNKKSNGKVFGYFWGYKNISAREVRCITFHGTTYDLKKNLQPQIYRTVMFDHMEVPLHDVYGSAKYWKARRSMRYNKELYSIANEFRLMYLDSNDVDDRVERPEDWRLEFENRDAVGGPYVSVHFRRRDFISGHSKSSPTVATAVRQIKKTLKSLNLKRLFVATDTNEEEFHELERKLEGYQVFRYASSDFVKRRFKDGGIAIIDQIICSHARYFIGTDKSTFTFRIQEDREILGFPSNTTFNIFCNDNKRCSPESRWRIVWD
ncbi:hypothetical protein QAD02_022191 [Eretmocerus hayati]|uniref:Uncharacterized protein n=1 Tax=Eretmocerus hayati TaxID=131215 RepID=A0ACC2PVL5_9HYME|nr:hypothetical protein QAD02_022191 [Eretmocerus hayati]